MEGAPLEYQPFQIELDRQRGAPPLLEQLAQAIRSRINAGHLQSGDRLPSSRELAAQLSVGRVTVTAAYGQLVAEGFLDSQVGKGTVVAARLPASRAERWDAALPEASSGSRLKRLPDRAVLAARAAAYGPQQGKPFAIVTPEYALLPGQKWEHIVGRLSRSPWKHNGYCDSGGYPPFRQVIADYLRRSRGVVCHDRQVIVTSGVQQGLHLCAQVLFNPGDKVLVEDPGFSAHRDLLSYMGLRTLPIPVDSQGIEVARIGGDSERASGVLVTPSHQYPMAAVLSHERRRQLLEWAYRNEAWLIEDDCDCELRYDGAPYPSLQSLDARRECVLYLGTFTKMIYPGFRLGYMVVPEALVDAFVGARFLNDRHSSEVHQVILNEFMRQGHYEAHIRRLKLIYQKRRTVLLDAGARWLGQWGQFIESEQGTHLTFVFHRPAPDAVLAQFLVARAGIELKPLSECYAGTPRASGFLMGFGGYPEALIESAVERLARELEQLSEEGFDQLMPLTARKIA